MMTLANYGIKSKKHKDPVSAKSLNESLQIRNRAESKLKQCLKTLHRIPNDKRHDILEAIRDYYARVPLEVVIWNKAQTKQSVVESILSLDHKFNPYKARNAFQTIENMLLNLHYLPWHKEFTRIVTYSGKFRQDISEPLVGAEDVLGAAGFQRESDEQPLHLVLPAKMMPQLDGTEHVTQVIFDCMLAQVIMNDIIVVLEGSCKSAKLSPNQLAASEDVNCYLWIQSYFQERCHQTTDKACSSIQGLLNNISNHLGRSKNNNSTRTPTKIERPLDNPAQLSHQKNGEASPHSTTRGDTFVGNQGVTQRQEHVRKLLAQRSLDNTNLLKLSDDLLKLPGERDPRNLGEIPFGAQHVDSGHARDIPYHDSDTVRDLNVRNQEPPQLDRRHPQPARYVPRTTRDFDVIDSTAPTRARTSEESAYEHSGYPTRVDLPHNDRELLIPKREKRALIGEHLDETRQPSRNLGAHYGNRLPGYGSPDQAATMNGPSNHLTGRRHYDEFPPLRSSQVRQSPQMSVKNSSSRYDHDSTHVKYEPRGADRPSYGLMHWSCNSCTFYNHESNETCEICGFRKL